MRTLHSINETTIPNYSSLTPSPPCRGKEARRPKDKSNSETMVMNVIQCARPAESPRASRAATKSVWSSPGSHFCSQCAAKFPWKGRDKNWVRVDPMSRREYLRYCPGFVELAPSIVRAATLESPDILFRPRKQ